MIYLELFWTYFKIGLFTIGGGYAMLPMVSSEIVDKLHWLTSGELLDFIAIAESTPGPFAINLATFVGYNRGSLAFDGNVFMGLLGSGVATFAVVLPSLVIIMIVSAVFEKFIGNKYVQGFFSGVRPVVIGLVVSAAITVLCSVVIPNINLKNINLENKTFDYISLILTAAFFGLSRIKIKNKPLHPIILIAISALTGLLLFGVILA
ncbi:MAG: chromate transporter [Clostridia bacterium]